MQRGMLSLGDSGLEGFLILQIFSSFFMLSRKLIQRPLSEESYCALGSACGDARYRVHRHPRWWERLMPGEDPTPQSHPCRKQPPFCPQTSLHSFASAPSHTWLRHGKQDHRKPTDPAHVTARHASAGRYQLCPWGRHCLHSPTGAGGGSQRTSRTQLHIQQPRQGPVLMPSALGDGPPVSSAQDLCVWYGGFWEYSDSDETAVSN